MKKGKNENKVLQGFEAGIRNKRGRKQCWDKVEG